MIGGEAPETCWATHKRQVVNLWNCCILLVDLFESYDDARTCERHIPLCYKLHTNYVWHVPTHITSIPGLNLIYTNHSLIWQLTKCTCYIGIKGFRWCYRHFSFKSWYGPAIQVHTLNGLMEINSLTVNDLARKHSRKCEGRKGIQKREPGQNIHQLSSSLQFYSSVCCSEILDFCYFEDIIHSVGVPVSDPQNVRLTLRRVMSYIYGAPILDVSRSHTTTQHSR